MSNLLYFYGMCGLVKELLLMRYFSKVSFCSGSIKFDTWFLTNIGLIGYLMNNRMFVAMSKNQIQMLFKRAEEYISIFLFWFMTVDNDTLFGTLLISASLLFLQFLAERQSPNVLRFLETINGYVTFLKMTLLSSMHAQDPCNIFVML